MPLGKMTTENVGLMPLGSPIPGQESDSDEGQQQLPQPKPPKASGKKDGAAPDVLYRVRMDSTNEHLRYSLRSLANLRHGEVFIVGYAPPWVNREKVTVLSGSKSTIKWRAGLEQFCLGVEQLRGRQLVLMDDDMYVLVKMDEVPVYNAGPLDVHANGKAGAYGNTFRNTIAYLASLGITEPISYERHVPLPVDADAAAEALRPAVDWMMAKGRALQGRTIYGNVAQIGGTPRRDAKAKPGAELPPDFLSTDDGSWSNGWAAVLKRMFPKRSPYELR